MKSATVVPSAPRELATPSDLADNAREAAIRAINPLVADAFALYVKTKNYHWHVSGSHYREYHLLLDEQADQVFAYVDALAERVRKLGGLTIHSIGEIGRLQRVNDDDDSFVTPSQMLAHLVEENKGFAARMRAAHKVAEDSWDVAGASLLETFIDETERRVWFLYETLVGGDRTS